MQELYCPQCNTLIPEGERVCPSCGFDLAEYDKEAEDEFNALLNAANKKLSEESDDEEAVQDAEAAPAADMPALENGTVTQEMIDAMMNGGSAPPPAAPAGKAPAPSGKAAASAGKAADAPAAEESGDEAEQAPGDGKKSKKKQKPPKAEKAPKEPKAAKAPKEKKQKAEKGEKAPKEKKGISSFIITLIAAVVAGALGFCVSMLIYADLFRAPEEEFAIKAANAVNSKLNINERLCVYKAYVKSGSSSDECMIYAVVDYSDSVTVTRYRVVVSRDAPNTINIYYPVDETSQAYLDMKNSSDPETRIQASVLKNYSDAIANANREILMGSSSWKEIDPVRINGSVTSKPTRNTGSSAGTQTSAPEE